MIESTHPARSKPRVLVAYHAKCIDGMTSAWIAVRGLEDPDRGNACVDMVSMEYTDDSTRELLGYIFNNDFLDLYVVDFSLSVEALDFLALNHPHLNVIILDHHKTAFERYAPGIFPIEKDSTFQGRAYGAMVYLDNDVSGAGICWDYFYPGEPVPKLVAYVQDYDLWRFNFGDTTKYINQYLRSKVKSLEVWDELAKSMQNSDMLARYIAEGKEIQAEHDTCVGRAAARALPVTMLGLTGLIVQCSGELASDVGHVLATRSGTFGVSYMQDGDTGQTKFSMRSVPDFDVSVMAMELGGGGHKNAAGFSVAAGIDVGEFLSNVKEAMDDMSWDD